MSDTETPSGSVAYDGLEELQELLERDLERIVMLRVVHRGQKHSATIGSIPLAQLKPEDDTDSGSSGARTLFDDPDPDDEAWDEDEEEEEEDEGPGLHEAWIDRALHWVRDLAARHLIEQDLPKARFQVRARMPGAEPGPFFHAENLLWEEEATVGPAIEHVPSVEEAKAALEGRTFDMQRELLDMVFGSAREALSLQEDAIAAHGRATDRSLQVLEDEVEFLRTENKRLVEHNSELHNALLKVKSREVKAMDIEARERAEMEDRKLRREGLNQAFAEVSKLGKAFLMSKGIPEELVPLLQTVAARPELAAVLQNPNTLAMLQDPELAPQIAEQLQAIGEAYQAEKQAAEQQAAAEQPAAASEAEGTETPTETPSQPEAEAEATTAESSPTPEPPSGSSELPPEPPPVK